MNRSFASGPARRAAGVAAVVLGAAACGPPVASAGSSTVHGINPSRIQGPHVPAGQRFSVRLDQPIDTQGSLRNGAFTAHLVEPLMDSTGRVLAPAGATVRGSIRSLGRVDSPKVRMAFETIDTVYGPAQLQATLRRAQYRQYPGPMLFGVGVGYPAYSGPYGWGPRGGGPGYYGYYDGYWDYAPYRPLEVQLPTGARMDLELTRPLLAPGAAVSPR